MAAASGWVNKYVCPELSKESAPASKKLGCGRGPHPIYPIYSRLSHFHPTPIRPFSSSQQGKTISNSNNPFQYPLFTHYDAVWTALAICRRAQIRRRGYTFTHSYLRGLTQPLPFAPYPLSLFVADELICTPHPIPNIVYAMPLPLLRSTTTPVERLSRTCIASNGVRKGRGMSTNR